MGKIAKNFIEEGVRLGVSSRGLGSVKLNKEGVNEVQDDFHLATVDIVADPSAPDAFVQGIMESAEWILENGVWKAVQIEQAQNLIRKASKADLNKVKLQVFEQFLRTIK
jgi:type III secretion system FlhB-like substrate exporter